jgi:hypothetical protein
MAELSEITLPTLTECTDTLAELTVVAVLIYPVIPHRHSYY